MPFGIIRDFFFRCNIFSINGAGLTSQMYRIVFQEGNVDSVCG